MALVTGVLADFGRGALTNYAPEVWFTPSGNAVKSPNVLYATRTIKVTPAPSTGAFTADLEVNELLNPATWYEITIAWLDGDGGYVAKDFLDWQLVVPGVGGSISDLISVPSNPARVWTSLTPPPNPTPGTWWFETDPNDPENLSNPAKLYEWSN